MTLVVQILFWLYLTKIHIKSKLQKEKNFYECLNQVGFYNIALKTKQIISRSIIVKYAQY